MEIISKEKSKRGLFRNRNFIIIFIGKLISQMGDVVYNMAVAWYILSITNSATQMSMYMIPATLLYFFCSPIGGILSDRLNRKFMMVWLDLIRGGMVAMVGLLMFRGVKSIGLFYLSTIVLSICGAFFVPASNAITPQIVENEDLQKANSLISTINNLSNIAGFVAGGILYAVIGIRGIFILDAVSYVISGIISIFIVVPKHQAFEGIVPTKKAFFRGWSGDIKDGFSFIKSEQTVYKIFFITPMINVLIVMIFAVFTAYIFNQLLKTSTWSYSYVETALSVGFIVGAIICSKLPSQTKVGKPLRRCLPIVCATVFGIYLCVQLYMWKIIGVTAVVILYTCIYFLLGATNSIATIPLNTHIQRIVPNHLLGRVSSLMTVISTCTVPVSILIGGIAADYLPINIIMLFISIAFVLLTIYIVQQDF